MSGQVNDFELVKLVESYPILYDKDKARGQKNAAIKDKAWREVSIKCDASERACITRWKSIRDRFGKEYRRVQESLHEPTSWELFPHLLFLKTHYKHGHASNDTLVDIKFEPRERKRKRTTGEMTSQAEDESNNEEDIDPEELLINHRLIALVKEHTVLYDKQKIRDSKNLTLKNDAWREISDSLGISEEFCYKRWKKLRDSFSREYRHYKLSPDKPVMWTYFHDLMFLEGHYRKGIPLPVDAVKQRKNNTTNSIENPWGVDYPYECLKDEPIPDNTKEYSEFQRSELMDELIIMPVKNLVPPTPRSSHPNVQHNSRSDTFSVTVGNVGAAAPEEKLTDVISNIQAVLRDTQDCLILFQDQKEQHKKEIESNFIQTQPGMLQKVYTLLEGLNNENRNKAERKILQFLCECQIKSLNNEEIDDVCKFIE